MLRNAATDRQTGVATLSLYDFIIMPSSACAGVYLLEHIDIYIYIYFIHERNVIKNYTRRFLNEIENVLRDNVYVTTHAYQPHFLKPPFTFLVKRNYTPV